MNCLSSEDLKEERNCSLTYKPTLNLDACPVYRWLITVAFDPILDGVTSSTFHSFGPNRDWVAPRP
jgi:hypothetical protein